ncbi:MAG: hypothetical protein U5K43_14830 [Halofilum sp. (in: g-proteobacteria)]|nr:hypothetical protein [Halofilum sp. (in: g-proteobacteria)]
MSADSRGRSARAAEESRLADVHARLQRQLDATEARLGDYARDIEEQKTYLSENRDEMDHVEKIASRESIDQSVRSGEFLLDKKKRLRKLQRSPYFGRFDVRRAEGETQPVYIGIHHFFDDAAGENVVYDWRAPIATLFYDYETGPARYQTPEGPVDCEIELKRQFRIHHDRIDLLIDSSVNVVDDVLQQELSRTSDEGMKNIVATIQRDQNAIVRDEEAHELVIQGVAGSGKTSIALHRIAFLLYRFKDTLRSEGHPHHFAQPRLRRLHRQRAAGAGRGDGQRDDDGVGGRRAPGGRVPLPDLLRADRRAAGEGRRRAAASASRSRRRRSSSNSSTRYVDARRDDAASRPRMSGSRRRLVPGWLLEENLPQAPQPWPLTRAHPPAWCTRWSRRLASSTTTT